MSEQVSFEARLFANLDQQSARIKSLEDQLLVMTVGVCAIGLLIGYALYKIGKDFDK